MHDHRWKIEFVNYPKLSPVLTMKQNNYWRNPRKQKAQLNRCISNGALWF